MKKFLKIVILFIMLEPLASLAEETIEIELNKLEDREESCRAYLLFRNNTDAKFEEFKLDLIMFGADGIISRRLAVDSSPLRPNKTSVRLFDIEGQSCQSVSLILINDVLSCEDGNSREDCINLIEASSKNDVSFVK